MKIPPFKQDKMIKSPILLAKIAKNGKSNISRPSGWPPKLGAKITHQHYRRTG